MLAVVGSAFAGLLLLDHHGISPAKDAVHQLCGTGEDSGCEQVSRSRFSSLAGFSVAGIGFFFYGSILLLLALALVSPEPVQESAGVLSFVLFGVALFLDVVLLGIQAFAIGAYCKLCLGTYVVNVLALLALLPAASRLPALAKTLLRGEGRSLLSVWAMGSLLLFFGVASLDQALASAEQPASLLGQVAKPAPSPAAPNGESDAGALDDDVIHRAGRDRNGAAHDRYVGAGRVRQHRQTGSRARKSPSAHHGSPGNRRRPPEIQRLPGGEGRPPVRG